MESDRGRVAELRQNGAIALPECYRLQSGRVISLTDGQKWEMKPEVEPQLARQALRADRQERLGRA